MASSTSSLEDPLQQAYINQQRQNVNDTYQIGLVDNNQAKAYNDLTYQQKLAALSDKLNQEQTSLPDSYAARGLENSGIYNFNGINKSNGQKFQVNRAQMGMGQTGGSLGAWQQFQYDKALSQGDLVAQQGKLDQQYDTKGQQLGLVNADNLASINALSPSDASNAAINDAIAGA